VRGRIIRSDIALQVDARASSTNSPASRAARPIAAGSSSFSSGTSNSQKSMPAAFMRANSGKCTAVKGRT